MGEHEITAERYHDISAGHRVAGHENKCQFVHGHNYRITFFCIGALDSVGRVIDFGVIKSRLCAWLEQHWDHKFLLWKEDPDRQKLYGAMAESVVLVPFNPTAENMAQYLVDVVGPQQLIGTDVELYRVRVEETRKCSATCTRR